MATPTHPLHPHRPGIRQAIAFRPGVRRIEHELVRARHPGPARNRRRDRRLVANRRRLQNSAIKPRADDRAANEHLADLEKKLEPFQANADQIPAALEVQVQKAVELIDAHAAETIKRVQAIEMLSERAVRLLGFDPDQPSDAIAPDSLMMLIQRGDELERTARGTANELAALHSVNEQVREQCSTVLTDTSGAIDKLANKRDEILSTIEQTLAGLDDAQPAYLGELLSARDQLAEIESRRSDVESDIGSVGEELARLENAVAEQLTNLRAQASEELSRLQVAVAAQRRSMAQLLTESPGESQPSGSKSNPNTESA